MDYSFTYEDYLRDGSEIYSKIANHIKESNASGMTGHGNNWSRKFKLNSFSSRSSNSGNARPSGKFQCFGRDNGNEYNSPKFFD